MAKARSRAGSPKAATKTRGGSSRPKPLGQHFQEAVFADGKADGGQLRPAQFLGQAVVAPAACHRVLGPEPHRGHLKGGAGVVVQAPDQPGLHLVSHVKPVQQLQHPGKVGGAVGAEIIPDHRGVV